MAWPLAGALAVAPPQTSSPPPSTQPAAEAPGEDLIEYLGTDDVGDATWWEFLSRHKARQGGTQVPTVPAVGGAVPAPPPSNSKP